MRKTQITVLSLSFFAIILLSMSIAMFNSININTELTYSLTLKPSLTVFFYTVAKPIFMLMGSSSYLIWIPMLMIFTSYLLKYTPLIHLALWSIGFMIIVNSLISLYALPEDGLMSGVIGGAFFAFLSILFGDSFAEILLIACTTVSSIKLIKLTNFLLNHLFNLKILPIFNRNGSYIPKEREEERDSVNPYDLSFITQASAEDTEHLKTLSNKAFEYSEQYLRSEKTINETEAELEESEIDEEIIAIQQLQNINLDFYNPFEQEEPIDMPSLNEATPLNSLKNKHIEFEKEKALVTDQLESYSTIESGLEEIGIVAEYSDSEEYLIKDAPVQVEEEPLQMVEELTYGAEIKKEALKDTKSVVERLKNRMKKMFEEQSLLVNRFQNIFLPIHSRTITQEPLSPAFSGASAGIASDHEYNVPFEESEPTNSLDEYTFHSTIEKERESEYLIDNSDHFNDEPYQGIPSFESYQYYKEDYAQEQDKDRESFSTKEEPSRFSPRIDLPSIHSDVETASLQDQLLGNYFEFYEKDGDKVKENESSVIKEEEPKSYTSYYGVPVQEEEEEFQTEATSLDDIPIPDSLRSMFATESAPIEKTVLESNVINDHTENQVSLEFLNEENNYEAVNLEDIAIKHRVIFEQLEQNIYTKQLEDHLNRLGSVEFAYNTVVEESAIKSSYRNNHDEWEGYEDLISYYHLNDAKPIVKIESASVKEEDPLIEHLVALEKPKSQEWSIMDAEPLLKVNDYRFIALSEEEKNIAAQLPESELDEYDDETTIEAKEEFFIDTEFSFIKEEAKKEEVSYSLPYYDLLEENNPHNNEPISPEEIEENGSQIIETLHEFNIQGVLEDVIVGPVVTRYEISPPKGLKVNKIIELSDNIALGLASKERVRIEAPVYGKSVVGVEVANSKRQLISFKDMLELNDKSSLKNDYHIPFILGKALDGSAVIKDIVKMPHLLIAGSTGSGKSVCINALINSILFYKSPDEVKLLLVDPKRVELILYDGLPHLISPVIKETTEAIKALKWLVTHMEERYYTLEDARVRNILEYNERQEQSNEPKMPYLVVVMDEFADLILLGKRDVEESVIRLAAMARAVGIHLVLATQRPSADVITGLIKANFASRIAFRVSSKMESRIILDENGAEDLLGKGDMLFMSSDMGGMTQRIQAPFISDKEVQNVTDFFKSRYESNYWNEVLEEEFDDKDTDMDPEDDALLGQAIDLVLKDRKASSSYLQRRLKIGYNRAATLIEMMEERGIVGRASGSKPREILIDSW